MNDKTIIVPGTPDIKMRPRAKATYVYDPNQQNEQKCLNRTDVTGHPGLLFGPLVATFTFYFPRPKSHYGTGRNKGKLKLSAPRHCMILKNIDNMVKFYLDAYNEVHYPDDRAVVALSAYRMWVKEGEKPRIVMTIGELE